MKKYEFGVMSSKWSLKAKNNDIAFLTMVLFIGKKSVPIAIYSPFEKTITYLEIVAMDNIGLFIDKNKSELIKARESIKEEEK